MKTYFYGFNDVICMINCLVFHIMFLKRNLAWVSFLLTFVIFLFMLTWNFKKFKELNTYLVSHRIIELQKQGEKNLFQHLHLKDMKP